MDIDKEIQILSDKIKILRQELKKGNRSVLKELVESRKKFKKLAREKQKKLSAWERVQLARHPKRPHTIDYIKNIFTDFVELHGIEGLVMIRR